jgi:hypothetical protein
MTTPVTSIWIHGNAVVAEHPENLLALDRRGWGTECQLQRGTKGWFHMVIPTLVILHDQRLQLVRVFLFFNTPQEDGHISEVHVYDGSKRLELFENHSLAGDCRTLMSGYNTFALSSPQLLYSGLGCSFLYHAFIRHDEPIRPSYLAIVAAGGDFTVES